MDIINNLTAWLTFDFTDDQWSGLVRFSGELPQSARTEFKNCISLYLLARRWHPEHEIEQRDRRERLRRKILGVLNDIEWKIAITSLEGLDIGAALGKPPPPLGQMLDGLLNLLATRLEYRNSRVSRGGSRPGPKSSQPTYQFIADAAALLEKYTQKPATRSEKSNKSNFRAFIKELCAIADAAITPGTIDEALKRYIKKRRR